MIIIGNENIPYQSIANISNIDDIQNTKPNQTLSFTYDIELIKYCFVNELSCLVLVSDIKEAIFCNSLNASYIVVKNSIAKEIQDIADAYMFDSKILEVINDDEEINKVAPRGIDGVIYDKLLKGILWEQ